MEDERGQAWKDSPATQVARRVLMSGQWAVAKLGAPRARATPPSPPGRALLRAQRRPTPEPCRRHRRPLRLLPLSPSPSHLRHHDSQLPTLTIHIRPAASSASLLCAIALPPQTDGDSACRIDQTTLELLESQASTLAADSLVQAQRLTHPLRQQSQPRKNSRLASHQPLNTATPQLLPRPILDTGVSIRVYCFQIKASWCLRQQPDSPSKQRKSIRH